MCSLFPSLSFSPSPGVPLLFRLCVRHLPDTFDDWPGFLSLAAKRRRSTPSTPLSHRCDSLSLSLSLFIYLLIDFLRLVSFSSSLVGERRRRRRRRRKRNKIFPPEKKTNQNYYYYYYYYHFQLCVTNYWIIIIQGALK